MTICNFCGKRETRNRIFKSPYTCNQCIADEHNYMDDDDESNDDIIYIDSTGKKVKVTNEEEMEIIASTSVNCIDDYKDALLASLYSQVEFLRNELVEKNLLIRTLIIKNANTYQNSNEIVTNEIIDTELSSTLTESKDENVSLLNASSSTKANSVEINESEDDEMEDEDLSIFFKRIHQEFEDDKEMNIHQEFEDDKEMNIKFQLKYVREELHSRYIEQIGKQSNIDFTNVIQESQHHKTASHTVDLQSISSLNETCFSCTSMIGKNSENGEMGMEEKLRNIAGYGTPKIPRHDYATPCENDGWSEVNKISSKKYVNRTVRSSLIIGDSMLRDIRGKRLSNKLYKQKVYVKPHGGAKIGDIKHHAIPPMGYKPNHIIVHVGTNEIRTKKTAKGIANDVMKVCKTLKKEDNSVSVSGIIYRKGVDDNVKVDETNNLLESLCRDNDFTFINNSNIPPRLLMDGLHLSKAGNDILFQNLFKCLQY